MERLWELIALRSEGVTGKRFRTIRRQVILSVPLKRDCIFINNFQGATKNDPGCNPPNGLVVVERYVEEDSLIPSFLAKTWDGQKVVATSNRFNGGKVNRALSRVRRCT